MNELPTEVIFNILLNNDYETILNYCRSYEKARYICQDRLFWIRKANRDFKVSPEDFNRTNLTPAQRYLELATERGYVTYGSENYLTGNEFAKRAIRKGRKDLFLYIINLGFANWSEAIKEVAKTGDENTLEYLLRIKPDYQNAAEGALEGRNKELFAKIMEKSPSNYRWDWDELTISAGKSGDDELIGYFKSIFPVDWEFVEEHIVYGSLKNGHRNIFDKYYSKKGPKLDWDSVLMFAGRSGNEELFRSIFNMVPENVHLEWDRIIDDVISGKSTNLVKYAFSLIPKEEPLSWDDILWAAAASGNQEVFNYLLTIIPKDWEIDWQWLADKSLYGGNLMLIQEILARIDNVDWNQLLETALRHEDLWLFKKIKSMVPPNYQLDSIKLIQTAISMNNPIVSKYIYDHYTK